MHLESFHEALTKALNLPVTATWQECLSRAESYGRKYRNTCEHDWIARGTADDKWWQCFFCGQIED